MSIPVEFHRRSSFEKYVAEAAAKSSSHLQNKQYQQLRIYADRKILKMERSMAFLTDEIIKKNGRMFDVLKGAFVTPNIQVESCVKGNYRQWKKKIKL